MSITSRFLWGAFGGFAVEFIRLWKLRDDKLGKPATYYLLSVGMAAISGAWAVAVANDGVALAQISVGISAPVAISGLAGVRSPATDEVAEPRAPSPPEIPEATVKTVPTAGSPKPSLQRQVRFFLRGLYK